MVRYNNSILQYYTLGGLEHPYGEIASYTSPRYNSSYSFDVYSDDSNDKRLRVILLYKAVNITEAETEINWNNTEEVSSQILRNITDVKTENHIEVNISDYIEDLSNNHTYIAWCIKAEALNAQGSVRNTRFFPQDFHTDGGTPKKNLHFLYNPSLVDLSIHYKEGLLEPGEIVDSCAQNLYIEFLQDSSMGNGLGIIQWPSTITPSSRTEISRTKIISINNTSITITNRFNRYYFQLNTQQKYTGLSLVNNSKTYDKTNFNFYAIPQLASANPEDFRWAQWPSDIIPRVYNVFDPDDGTKVQLTATCLTNLSAYKIDKISLYLNYNNMTQEIETNDYTSYKQLLAVRFKYNLFNFDDTLPFPTWNGTYNIQTSLKIVNEFDEEFILGNTTTIFNFNKAPATPSINEIYWATSSSSENWNILNDEQQAVEGIYLKFDTTLNLYSQEVPQTELWLQRGEAAPVLEKVYTTYNTQLNYASSSDYASTQVDLIYGPIKEISTSNARYWTIKVKTTAGDVSSGQKIMQVANLTAPVVTLNNCILQSDNSALVTYTKNQLNGAEHLDLYLIDANHSDSFLFDDTITSIGETLTSIVDIGNTWSNVNNFAFQIQAYSSISSSNTGPVKDVTKQYTSNIIRFVKKVPTISYYPNQLGINTDAVTSDAILDIHSYQNKNQIYLYDANSINYFKFDTTNGTIIWHTDNTDYSFIRQ